jgi:hypothetical protein
MFRPVFSGMKTEGSISASVVTRAVIRPHPTTEVVEKERQPLSNRNFDRIIARAEPTAAKRKEYPQLKGRGIAKGLYVNRAAGLGSLIRNGLREP